MRVEFEKWLDKWSERAVFDKWFKRAVWTSDERVVWCCWPFECASGKCRIKINLEVACTVNSHDQECVHSKVKIDTHGCVTIYHCIAIEVMDAFPFLDAAVCYGGCQNGGRCVAPGKCSCTAGYKGHWCELRKFLDPNVDKTNGKRLVFCRNLQEGIVILPIGVAGKNKMNKEINI